MAGRFPKHLMIGLAAAGALFLALGAYVEIFQLDFLQDHPIATNLLSGVVAFPFASLAIAFGFNWFVERELLSKMKASIPAAWQPIVSYCSDVRPEPRDDQEVAELNEGARLSRLLSLHEQMIKFHIPLVVYLLDLQGDFLVISHPRLAEGQHAALAALPSARAKASNARSSTS